MARTRILAAGIVVVLAEASEARGAVLSWNNAAGGNASTAANWNPAQVPVLADDLVFNILASYTVNWSAAVAVSDTHTVRDGTVTYNITSPHAITGALIVADLAADTATLTLTTGTLTANASSIIGDAATSVGIMNVNDDDADFIVSGTASDLHVGLNGTGMMDVSQGGFVEIGDDLIVGNGTGSSGELTVFGVNMAPFVKSTVQTIQAGTGDIFVGNNGQGVAEVNAGAQMISADDVFIGANSTAVGDISVSGSSSGGASLLLAADNLYIGGNEGAGAGGDGDLFIFSPGSVVVNNLTRVGDVNGTNGSSLVIDAGTMMTGSLEIVPGGTTFTFEDGELEIFGGTFSHNAASLTINGGGLAMDDPELVLSAGARSTLTGTVTVASTNVARLTLTGAGTELSTSPVTLSVGTGATSDGTVRISSGANANLGANTLTLGDAGAAILDMDGGGTMTCGAIQTSKQTGSSATLVLDQGLTRIDASGNVTLGGDGAGGDGLTFVTMSGNAPFSPVLHTTQILSVLNNGTINLIEAILEADVSLIVSGGDINMTEGVLTSPSMALNSGGTITGSGTFNGIMNINAGCAVTTTGVGITANGRLLNLSGGTLTGGILTIGAAGELWAKGGVPEFVESFGGIFPGGQGAAGEMTIASGLQLNAGGTLGIEIGGRSLAAYDHIEVTDGGATLGGQLTVTTILGFTPVLGQVFTIVTSTGNTGQFSSVSGPQGMRVDYFANAVQVVMTTCFADVTHDGLVNIDDLTEIILNWNGSDADADVDGDNVVEIDDLTAVILGWGACP